MLAAARAPANEHGKIYTGEFWPRVLGARSALESCLCVLEGRPWREGRGGSRLPWRRRRVGCRTRVQIEPPEQQVCLTEALWVPRCSFVVSVGRQFFRQPDICSTRFVLDTSLAPFIISVVGPEWRGHVCPDLLAWGRRSSSSRASRFQSPSPCDSRVHFQSGTAFTVV